MREDSVLFQPRHTAFLLPLGTLLILAGGCSKDLAVTPFKRATVGEPQPRSSGPGSGGTVAAVASIVLNPASVTSGATSVATVTLSAAAPAGGTSVGVTSSNTAV